MDFALTDDEYRPLSALPIEGIIDLAAALELVVPAQVDRRDLLVLCAHGLVELGHREKLPFSKYDAEDLAELTPEELSAIARLQGLDAGASVKAIIKVGEKVYKSYHALRIDHPVPLMLPMLLSAVARAAVAPTQLSEFARAARAR